jgi:hypothetical protein
MTERVVVEVGVIVCVNDCVGSDILVCVAEWVMVLEGVVVFVRNIVDVIE